MRIFENLKTADSKRQHKYPKISEIKNIEELLRNRALVLRDHPIAMRKYVNQISQLIEDAALIDAIPDHQQLGWLRVAALFRLAVHEEPDRAATAAAALEHLYRSISQGSKIPQAISELEWVLDSTLSRIAPANWAGSTADLLSDSELRQIESHLQRTISSHDFDVAAVQSAIESQLGTFRAFAALTRITNIDRKIELLLEVARRGGDTARPARAALTYLAMIDDVVPDSDGLLGLLDDLYAVEWGYASVEAETRQIPLVQDMVRKWPYLASSLITIAGRMLERYPRYVLGAANSLLFETGSGSIVVRDVGGFPLLIAVSSALQCARLDSNDRSNRRSDWAEDDPLVIDDGVSRFRIRYGGCSEMPDKVRIKVAGNGASMLLDTDAAKYLRPSSDDFKRLSKGSEISEWRDNRHLHPLHFFCGGRSCVGPHAAVLLVTRRGKVEHLLPELICQGMEVGALLGVVWAKESGDFEPLNRTTDDRPLIYICGSADIAFELVENRPEHVSEWKIIVDGAPTGRDLRAMLREAGVTDTVIVTVTSLAQSRDDSERRFWLVEDHDVLPAGGGMRGFQSASPLARFLDRQTNHWHATFVTAPLASEQLEHFSDAVAKLPESDDGPGNAAFKFCARKFLRDATKFAVPDEVHLEGMKSAAEQLRIQAATFLGNDETARRTKDVLTSITEDGLHLPDVAESIRAFLGNTSPGMRTVVVSETADIAARNRVQAASIGLDADFMSFRELTIGAPYDHVVVVGWMQSERMRRIALNGYARRTTFLLLPFQKQWLDRTLAATARWEQRLESLSRAVAGESKPSGGSSRKLSPWPKTERRPALEKRPSPPEGYGGDIEELDRTGLKFMAAAIAKPAGVGETAKGRFILLEDDGGYCLLPPDGSVIVLPDTSDGIEIVDHEHELLTRVRQLRPGMVLAFSSERNRDVVDAFADLFLQDAEATRDVASLWRQPVRSALKQPGGVDRFRRSLIKNGVERHPMTIRSWTSDNGIAPRNYKRIVPVLALLSNDPDLMRRVPETLKAIDRIYAARREGGKRLLEAVFDGDIDLSASRLDRDFDGKRISFDLHRVAAIGDIIDCAREDIGAVQRYAPPPSGDSLP